MRNSEETVRCPQLVRADGMDNLPAVHEMQDELDLALMLMWKKAQECDEDHRHDR